MLWGATRTHGVAMLGYCGVAMLFAWPLPLRLGDSLLGSPAGDLGVYIWNLWVFRHEIVVHHQVPFFTLEILSLTPKTPLVLQNYTTVANLLAFPFLSFASLVATFNVLTIASGVFSAYAMFVYAHHRTGDAAAAWVGGLLFGFSPFMSARAGEHFSLIQAAPLPVFGYLMLRLSQNPTRRLSAIAGAVVAWAFLSDPYYAVYCLMILTFMIGYSVVDMDFHRAPSHRDWWMTLLDVLLICIAGLIVGIIVRGGGRVEWLGVRVSVTRLYTPVLAFTILATCRLWLVLRPRLRWALPSMMRLALPIPGAIVLGLLLAPMLYPMASSFTALAASPTSVFWRNSAPGLDVASYLLPNPLHPWFGGTSAAWIGQQPNGFAENVASLPWVAIASIVIAILVTRHRPHKGWIAFTALFAWLSLGPFVSIAGLDTYVPTPWALLRYLPVIGAARMPTRLAVLTIMGVSMLLAMALQHLRAAPGQRRWLAATVSGLLIVEMFPGPRTLYSAHVPDVNRVIAADSREVRVLNLPFGLRDGLSSAGNVSAEGQFQQTVHEKPLVGGYLSRLPRGEVQRYRRIPVMAALLDLSEGKGLSDVEARAAIASAHEQRTQLNIGWVVVDTRKSSRELVNFTVAAFDLTFVSKDGGWELYRVPLNDLP